MKGDVDQRKENKRRAADRKRRLATARTGRYRKRQDEGINIAPTPYNNDIVALLLDLNQLLVENSEDPDAIGEAIFKMLSETAKNRK